MDERFNRRLLLLIAGLLLVGLTLTIPLLRHFVKGIDDLVPWPMELAVSFNVIVLVATAVITVGHFDRALVARFFALVVACKAVATGLTAAWFMITAHTLDVVGALLEAGLGSWSASVLHAIGALVVARVLRAMVMGRQLAVEAPPEGIILPTLTEPEMLAGERRPTDEMWLAPPEPGVDPLTSPTAAAREQAEGEEELDRVVAGTAPVTADLETMPDRPAPEPELEEAARYEEAEVVSDAEAVPETELVSDAKAVPETEAVAEEEVVADAGVFFDAEAVADEEAVSDEEAVPGEQAVHEPEPVYDSEVEPGTEPEADEVAAAAATEVESAAEPAEAAAPEEPVKPEPEAAGIAEPVAERVGAPGEGSAEIALTISEILGCFGEEDIALTHSEVREARGGDEYVRVPLDAVLPQIENGVVQVEADLIFNQLPRAAFRRPPEEVAGSLWQGKVELPLERVVAQVPPGAMRRSYKAEQEAADEFPDPFKDTLAAGAPRGKPVEREAAKVAEAPAEVRPEPAEEEAAPAPVEEVEAEEAEEQYAEAPVSPELAEEPRPVAEPEPEPAAPVAQETAPAFAVTEPVVGAAPPSTPPSAPPPGVLNISAEYIVAQFPDNAMAMPIEDIEAKLDPHGTLKVPIDEVLPQLAEGSVAVNVVPLLEQLPPGAVGISWGELADTLPEGKVQLPLEEIVGQIPADMLSPGVAQIEQDSVEEIPEPFVEKGAPGRAPAPAEAAAPAEEATAERAEERGAERVEERVAEPESAVAEAPEPAREGLEGELEEALGAAADIIEVPWPELLPQFPADAFRVSRDQLNSELETKAARIDVDLVAPQLGEGQVTVPCGYLLAQFPDEYLELTVEQIAERMPEGRFELPLVTVIMQLPQEALALPADQTLQESTDEIPTVFAEPGTEKPAEEAAAEAVAPEMPEEAEAPREAEPEAVAQGVESEPETEVWEAPPEEVAAEPAAAEEALEPAEEVEEPWPEAAGPEPEAAGPEPEAAGPEPEVAELPDEPSAEPADAEGLTESDITQLESILADKRQEEAAFEDEGEFVDDLFVSGAEEAEEAVDVAMPVLEPEPPAVVEEPAVEEPAAEAQPVEPARAAEPPFELDEEEAAVGPAEAPALEPSAAMVPQEPVEEVAAEASGPAAEDVVVGEPARAERVEAVEAPLAAASLTDTAHRKETFRNLIHGYAKYHVEHGTASIEAGRLVFSFTPAETSAEVLARELSPRFEALARFTDSLGCEPLERAVVMADKGAVVCEWLPEDAGAGLVLLATTDRRAAGMMHLQARHDSGLLSRLSAELRAEAGAAVGTPDTGTRPWDEPEGCEIAWPGGHPYDEIGDLLAAYDITAVALLRFDSGARWMLASPTLDEHEGLSTGSGRGCYNPSELLELPEELRLGKVQSVLAMAGRNVITVNAPAPGSELGLICVFPGQFREGLLKRKADKASALLCGV